MAYQRRAHYRFGNAPFLHACAGVLCPLHLRCARYAFVDGTREPSNYWLGTCVQAGADGLPELIGFIAVDFVGPPAPRQWFLLRGNRHAPRWAHDMHPQPVAPLVVVESEVLP